MPVCEDRKDSDRVKTGQNLSRNMMCAPNAEAEKRNTQRRRASFSASLRGMMGSLTLEAALVLPLFLFFMLGFLYFILLIGVQIRVQAALEEVAAELVMLDGAVGTNGELEGEIYTLLAVQAAKAQLSGSLPLVKNGVQGLDFSESSVSSKTQEVTLSVTYTVSLPLGLLGSHEFTFTQRSCRRIWSGSSGTSWKVTAASTTTTEQSVYITPTGTVYHLYADCSYLSLSVRKVAVSELSTQRSEDGSIYYACSYCKSGESSDYVYVTSYGNRYHLSLTCSELTRSVSVIGISEVGSRKLCSRCESRAG